MQSATPDMPADTGNYTAIVEVFKASVVVTLQRATIVWGKPLGTVYTRVCVESGWTQWAVK